MIDIQLILDKLRIELSGSYRIKAVQDAGDNIMVNCPFHDDRSPSFGILKEEKRSSKGMIKAGHGHCFSCMKSAPLGEVISQMYGYLDEGEFGRQWLLDNFNITESQINFNVKIHLPIVPKVIEYEKYVGYHPYYAERGITEETAKDFSLGFNEQFQQIVIPVFDKFDVCRMTVSRNIHTKQFRNTKDTDKESLLYGLNMYYRNLHKLEHINSIYVVESAIDAMLLWQQGKVAVALLQAQPTSHQIKMLFNLPLDNVVMAMDNDEAGELGVALMMKQLYNKNLYRVVFPEGTKDIGDFTEQQIKEMNIIERHKQTRKKETFGNPLPV